MDLAGWSAGAIVATLVGERSASVAGSLGARAALRLLAPAADTFQAALQAATRGCALFDAARLHAVVLVQAGSGRVS
jgi:hypothetical protein